MRRSLAVLVLAASMVAVPGPSDAAAYAVAGAGTTINGVLAIGAATAGGGVGAARVWPSSYAPIDDFTIVCAQSDGETFLAAGTDCPPLAVCLFERRLLVRIVDGGLGADSAGFAITGLGDTVLGPEPDGCGAAGLTVGPVSGEFEVVP